MPIFKEERMNEEQIKELTEATARSKSNTKRLDALEKSIELMHEMNNNIAKIVEQLKDTKMDVKDLKTDVEEIKSKPNKFLDNLKGVAAGAVITAIIGTLMALIM